MKGILRAVCVIGLVLQLSGCGTFIGRLNDGLSDAQYYRGVDGSLHLLGVRGSDGMPAAIVCYMMIVCPVITVVSLPVDAALDTVLLPVDYINTL
ncbi:YceK/YidQ family lipoprotein [Pseudomonas koreensis]|uniref:YceK/YidQ family lipoprotein n=1 Tax=Pseudomonas koreensis TaxID=198620 RepID=UPI0010BFB252|nr:YceK/YidQ family lipoprotein [Pseudomonas koreensis]TKJ82809.1 YceK/YidQ family lipoprotein [Pseudomonas koreensis]